MSRQTGSQLLCRAMERLGAEHIFGLPGTQSVELFEALRRSSIRTILATHELAAGFMANGYFRASGKIGWLTTIPGPGLCYAIAALAEAHHDSSAMVYIVGQPATGPGRRFLLQALDQKAVLGPVVKAVIDVDAPEQITAAAYEAHHLALTGEPGPVVLHMHPRLFNAEVLDTAAAPCPLASPGIDPVQATEVIRRLHAATKIAILAGQGAIEAAGLVRDLAEACHAVVVTTRSGRGVIPETHPRSLPPKLSDRGLQIHNTVFERSDLILAIGCKLAHNGTHGFAFRIDPNKLIHVDASEETLNANYPAGLAICASAHPFLRAILQPDGLADARPDGWTVEEIARLRASASEGDDSPEPLIRGKDSCSPAKFFAALRAAMPTNAALVTDSGLHQVLATRHYTVLRPREMILPSDFQSMGFGLPAAIGAKLASPAMRVVALIGDGGFAMTAMELATAVRERVPVVVVVFNDQALGQIRMQQLSSYGSSHATELATPDVEQIARATGAKYIHFQTEADLCVALTQDKPVVLEVTVGDSSSVQLERAKGFARRLLRETVRPNAINWLKSKLQS